MVRRTLILIMIMLMMMINQQFVFHFPPLIALQDVEEVLKRIQGHKGVIGTIVINQDGELKF